MNGMKSFEVRTTKKFEVLDITDQVQELVGDCKACLVFTPHATAAITTNEYEPNIKQDYERFYEQLSNGRWAHDHIDNNASAHLMSSLIKPSLVLPVENSRLVVGTWQSILFVELDGPRTRNVIVKNL